VLFVNLSRVIAPNLRTAPAALEGQAVVLARNAIAAARSVTLRVRAPRRPEEEAVQVQEATAVEAEATVVLGAGAAGVGVGAVKKHGAFSRRVLSRRPRGTNTFCFRFFLKLHLWWSRPSIA
jgi:hypothetical protein